jgi:hypothetical protein
MGRGWVFGIITIRVLAWDPEGKTTDRIAIWVMPG